MAVVNLTEFLARLAESHAIALEATPGPWIAESSGPTGQVVMDAESQNALDHVAQFKHYRARADAVHVARHDPSRVLADIAAKRALIQGTMLGLPHDAAPFVLRCLAYVDREHPDFEPAWRAAAWLP